MRIRSIAAALFCVSCSEPSPEKSFDEMQEAACSGDSAAFFSYIDRAAVVENTVTLAVHLDPDLAGRERSIRDGAKRNWDDGFDRWAENIKRGSDSKFCTIKRAIWQDVDWVRWTDGEGMIRRSRFELAGDKFLLVEIRPGDR